MEVPKIFPDGTIGRKITTADLREFLTTYGDDPLSDADVQELIQVIHKTSFILDGKKIALSRWDKRHKFL